MALRLPCPGCGSNPQELASGVDRLAVTYGIDGGAVPGQRNVDHYAAADGATPPWAKVVSVRLQMLVATAKDGVAQRRRASTSPAPRSRPATADCAPC